MRRELREQVQGVRQGLQEEVVALALLLVAGTLALGPAVALAEARTQRVAVLPFTDLSGSKARDVGGAIRETVTADLAHVPGFSVVERERIESVLHEVDRQASGEMDKASTVKLGQLLGASIMVAGAYQRAGSTVRLTARFIRVETGEIIGAAKVDGEAADFLALQDRVTVELLTSAGIPAVHVARFRKPRPRLKSLRPLELYAQSLAAPTDDKRVEYLRLAVAEDSGYSYAVHDLEQIEGRMRAARAEQQRANNERVARTLAETRAKLAANPTADERTDLERILFAMLLTSRRDHEAASEARRILSDKSRPPAAVEQALGTLVEAEAALRDEEGVLRDGDRYQQQLPSGPHLSFVHLHLERVIARRRAVDKGLAEIDAAIAEIPSAQRWDLCRLASVYEQKAQERAAQRLLRACVAVEPVRKEAFLRLLFVDVALGDFAAARLDAQRVIELDPANAHHAENVLATIVPTDG